jgi:hypothetical protein
MTQSRTSEPKGLLSFWSVLCVALVFMIFAWGTAYKLSLYNNVEGGTSSAPAKVCTLGSDAAKSALDYAADGPSVAHGLLCTVLVSIDPGAEEHPADQRIADVVSDLSPLSRAPILYLRPPPNAEHSLD